MNKVKNAKGDTNYTAFQKVHAGETLVNILRPNVKGVAYDSDKTPSRNDLDPGKMQPDYYTMEKKRLVPKEAEYVRENLDKLVKKIVDDRTEFTYKADQKKLDELGKKYNTNYRPLSFKEKKEREKMSEQMCNKYAEHSAKRVIAEYYADRAFTGEVIGRTDKCLLCFDLSDEGLERNEMIRDYLHSPDPKEKAKAYAMKLNELVQIDISGIEATNDQYIIEHYEELADMAAVAAESKALLDSYQKLSGVDMSGEEYKPFFEKLGAVADIGLIIKSRVDIMCSQVYRQMRTDDLMNNPDFLDTQLDPQTGADEIDQALFGDADSVRPVRDVFSQIQFYNQNYIGNPLINDDLTPEQRLQEYNAHYWDKGMYHEIRPLNTPAQKQQEKASPQPDAAEKQNQPASPQPKDAEKQNQPASPQPKADPSAEQKEIMRRNIQKIQEVFPDFVITEEQIDAYYTPERVQIRDAALKYQDKQKTTAKCAEGVPASYARSAYGLKKDPSEPGAAEYNAYVDAMLVDPSSKGDEFRKSTTVNLINSFAGLDKNNFGGKSFTEIAQYTQQNQDLCDMGMEFQNTMTMMKHSMGFEFDASYSNDLKNIQDKAVCLGTAGKSVRLIAASDYYYTFPFEQLTSEQLLTLSAMPDIKLEGLDKNALVKVGTEKFHLSNYDNFNEPEGHEYSANDIHDTIPSLDDVQKKCKESLDKLEAAKSVSSRTDSTEYKDMLKALHTVLDVIEKKDDNPQFTDDFTRAINNVSGTAKAYVKHVGEKGKNATQQKRRDAASEIHEYVGGIGSDLNDERIAETYKEQKLLAQEAERGKEQAKLMASQADIDYYRKELAGGVQQQRDRVGKTLENEKMMPKEKQDTIDQSVASIMTYNAIDKMLEQEGAGMTKTELESICNNSTANEIRNTVMENSTFKELCSMMGTKDYQAIADGKFMDNVDHYKEMYKIAEQKTAEITAPKKTAQQKTTPEKTTQQNARTL